MEDRIFKYALIVSLLIHILAIARFSYSNTNPFKMTMKDMEIAYFKLKPQPQDAQASLTKQKKVKLNDDQRAEVRLKQPKKTSSFIKDLSKLFDKFELPKKQPAKVDDAHPKRKITVPPLKSEKINNPTYLNYYQIVRGEIKERAYTNYDQYDTGEVYLTFVISSDGVLSQIKLIEDQTSATQYLREISLKSVRDANPFPPFPGDLKYPELTFNVIISFKEIEE